MRVYKSLARPRLLAGAEWRLTFLNAMLCLILAFAGGFKWWTLALAGFLASGGQWLLRAAARRDPQWTTVYVRHLLQPSVREAHGSPLERPEKPRPVLPNLPRWLS
jgi:type IV secretory pathway TrbD component